MDSDFMNEVTGLLVAEGVTVARFEFPYMIARRETGKKRPPDRGPILEAEFRTAITEWSQKFPLFIGGKSMGGRIASMVVDGLGADLGDNQQLVGLVCLGYPFHPAGRPEKTRTDHLVALRTPALICQGERDTFGTREDVESYTLSERIAFHWAPDGNHDLTPRKKSGFTREDNLQGAVQAMIGFMRARINSR